MAAAAAVDSLGVDAGVDHRHQAPCHWSIGSIPSSDWSADSTHRPTPRSPPRLGGG